MITEKNNEKGLAVVKTEIKIASNDPVLIMQAINKRIDQTPASECKEDLRLLINCLVEFVAMEDPEILNPTTDENKLLKKFFSILVNNGMDAMLPWKHKELKAKFGKFMKLFPVIQKYGQTYISGDDQIKQISNE